MAEVDVSYSINGIDLSTMNVYVSSSSGFLAKPEAKEVLSAEWDGIHGTIRDLSVLKFKGATIQLNCFIHADGYSDFIEKTEAFLAIIQSPLITLSMTIGSSQTLTRSNLYMSNEAQVTMQWNESKMVGTFTLKFGQYIPDYAPSAMSVWDPVSEPTDGDIHYSLDGVDLGSYGIIVESSKGLFSKAAQKEVPQASWSDQDGNDAITSKALFKERTIELKCFAAKSSSSEFMTTIESLMQVLGQPETHRLRVSGGSKPLVYQVYNPTEVGVTHEWLAGKLCGSFTLKLVEPEPVKMVIQASESITITINSVNLLNIYWGDGSYTYDVSGFVTKTHSYSKKGNYEVIITGGIENAIITHNGTTIWNRLI